MARASASSALDEPLRRVPVPRACGPHVQALHLADGALRIGAAQRTQRDAADGRARRTGEQQAAARRRVGAGQRGELLGESLEAEVDREPRRVFLEQRAGVRDVGGATPPAGSAAGVKSRARTR